MSVVISSNSKRKIYHIGGCQHERRIREEKLIKLSAASAEKQGYRKCRCCEALKQRYLKRYENLVAEIANTSALEFRYDKRTSTYYFRTDRGFWKAFFDALTKGYKLYHRNDFQKDAAFESLKWGNCFHRQGEVSDVSTLGKAIHYIAAHEKAGKIIEIDYRKLPQKTSKERYYYKKAEAKHKRREAQRLDHLLDQISGGRVNCAVSAW